MKFFEVLERLHKEKVGYCLMHKPCSNLFNLSIQFPNGEQKYFNLKSAKELEDIICKVYEGEEEEDFDL